MQKSYLRYWILTVSTVLMTLIYANNVAFNFTIICMIPEENDSVPMNEVKYISGSNATEKPVPTSLKAHYDYSPLQRNMLFSATAAGTLLGGLPLAFFADKFGVRKTYTMYSVMSGAATLFLPLSASIDYVALFAVRVIQGIGLAPIYVMLSSVSAEWATVATTGSYLICLSAMFQFGPIMTIPTAGLLCESELGWPAVYYIQGVLTLVLTALFFFLFRDSPVFHPAITEKELKTIQRGKVMSKKSLRVVEKVPYTSIIKDPIVWVTLYAFFGDELGYQIFQQYGPIFLNKAHGMSVHETGFAATIPYMLALLTKLIIGPVSDRITCASDRMRINVFSIISQGGAAICFFILALLPMLFGKVPLWIVQVFYSSVNLFCGVGFLGVLKSSEIIAQHFSHVLMAWESIISSLIVLILPLAINVIAPKNTVEEWSRVFIGVPCIQILAITAFVLFCDSKPRKWTGIDSRQSESSSEAGLEKY
ncbi:major facilitator superfamily domain-containing protein [Ditylenchus destructor]|nr:major facilitator superfamily domain-containing protein [Ditylenchus destructor]